MWIIVLLFDDSLHRGMPKWGGWGGWHDGQSISCTKMRNKRLRLIRSRYFPIGLKSSTNWVQYSVKSQRIGTRRQFPQKYADECCLVFICCRNVIQLPIYIYNVFAWYCQQYYNRPTGRLLVSAPFPGKNSMWTLWKRWSQETRG